MYKTKTINHKIGTSYLSLTLPKAIHIIENYLHTIYPKKTSQELYKHIRFRANPTLKFPKSEISNLTFIEENQETYVEVEINFLSLYGSATPLPIHYAEKIREDFNDEQVLFDFITLFNHHLQTFIYPIWERQRYYINYKKDLKDNFSKYLLSILGLYPQTQEEDMILDFHKLLPFLGILNMKSKASKTLTSIIKYYINHNHIKIEECVISRAIIPEWQKNTLGEENSILGSNFIIGDFTTVRNLKFRIFLNDISWDYLYNYSFLGQKSKELKDLISFTLKEPLDYDISLNIQKKNIKKLYLNKDSDIFLGINSWIGTPSSDNNIILSDV